MSSRRLASDDALDLAAPPRTRRLIAALVVMLHVVAVLGLIRAFAPDFTAKVAGQVLSTLTVTVTTPPPSPKSPPPSVPGKAGAAAEVGKNAVPRQTAAPRPRIAIAAQNAPPVAGTGAENAAGASNAGQGTGAGGKGSGTGAGEGGSGQGGGGSGQGGGAASKAVKIAGDINSARDYPSESREARIGDSVVVALTVGTDGRVRRCRIHRASKDPQSDQITCHLASERFRFRPATDGNGNPVESTFGWQQRWFFPGSRN